jgi:hypothetical protein
MKTYVFHTKSVPEPNDLHAEMENISCKITFAAFMQRFQYDLGSPAAKDNSIRNAATARSNLDAAIHLHFIGNAICIAGTILQLQITMDFCRPHMYQKQVKP